MYATGAVVGKLLALLMLPALTRLLTPTQFGIADLLMTIGSAAISLLLLGLDIAATRLAVGPNPQFPPPQVYGSWFASSSFIMTIPAAAVILLARPIGSHLFGEGTDPLPVALVGVITIAGTYQFMALTILRAERRPVAYSIVSGGTLTVYAALAIVLVAWWHRDASSVVLAFTLSVILWAIVGFCLVGRDMFSWPRVESIKSLIRLGIPLAPAVAATWVAELANRLILLGSSDAAQVAYLGIGLRIASVAGLVYLAFQLGWIPHAYARGTGPVAFRETALDARRIIVLVSTSIMVIGLLAPELVWLIGGAAFIDALSSVGLSLVATLGATLFLVTSMSSTLNKRMGVVSMSAMFGVGAALICNMALSSRFGAAGTAGALAIGQFTAAGFAELFGRRSAHLPIPWFPVSVVICVAILGVCVATIPAGGAPLFVRFGLLILYLAIALAEGTLVDLFRRATVLLRSRS